MKEYLKNDRSATESEYLKQPSGDGLGMEYFLLHTQLKIQGCRDGKSPLLTSGLMYIFQKVRVKNEFNNK